MSVYLVDRTLPGITMVQLAAAQKSAIETSRRFSEDGKPIRYIRSVYVPGESNVMYLFESGNEALVRDVNQVAGIPFTRVLEAYDLTP